MSQLKLNLRATSVFRRRSTSRCKAAVTKGSSYPQDDSAESFLLPPKKFGLAEEVRLIVVVHDRREVRIVGTRDHAGPAGEVMIVHREVLRKIRQVA